MSKYIIYNAKLFIDSKFQNGFLTIVEDFIETVSIGKPLDLENYEDYQKIDAQNGYVSYGFIDPHVHFRTPGSEYKEDWKSGSQAAIKGGYTYVFDMPNTKPAATDYSSIKEKYDLALKDSLINFGFHIGLTDNNASTIKNEIEKCRENNINIGGIKAFLGSSTGDLLIKDYSNIEKALSTNEIVLFHAENDDDLNNDAIYKSLNEHEKNRPVLAEENAISIIGKHAKSLSKTSNIYICHVSSPSGVLKALEIKKQGHNVFTEITPHHIFLTLEKKYSNEKFAKINPPIRHKELVELMQKLCSTGAFSICGTDHAPHSLAEKLSDNPPSGFPGLETSFYILNELVKQKTIEIETVFSLLTAGYSIFSIPNRGELKPGNFADITIVKNSEHIFNPENALSKAKFSPFGIVKSNIIIDTVFVNGNLRMKNNLEVNNEIY